MVVADSECPKCGKGIMKLVPETEPVVAQPEQSGSQARCTVCDYQDTVTIRADD